MTGRDVRHPEWCDLAVCSVLTLGPGGAHMRVFPVEVDGVRVTSVVLRADRDGLVTVGPVGAWWRQGWEPRTAAAIGAQMVAVQEFLTAGRVV